MCPPMYTQRIASGNCNSHECTALKEGVNPRSKAHLFRSELRLVGALCLGLWGKDSQPRLAAFRGKIMQRLALPSIRLVVYGCLALGLATLASGNNLSEQITTFPASLQPIAATHETR